MRAIVIFITLASAGVMMSHAGPYWLQVTAGLVCLAGVVTMVVSGPPRQ